MFSLKPLTVATGSYGAALYEWDGTEPSSATDTFDDLNSFAIHPVTHMIYGMAKVPTKSGHKYLVRVDTTGKVLFVASVIDSSSATIDAAGRYLYNLSLIHI